MTETLKDEWLKNPGKNIMAGIVVALALIPEAIAFSIIAGVDPMIGLLLPLQQLLVGDLL